MEGIVAELGLNFLTLCQFGLGLLVELRLVNGDRTLIGHGLDQGEVILGPIPIQIALMQANHPHLSLVIEQGRHHDGLNPKLLGQLLQLRGKRRLVAIQNHLLILRQLGQIIFMELTRLANEGGAIGRCLADVLHPRGLGWIRLKHHTPRHLKRLMELIHGGLQNLPQDQRLAHGLHNPIQDRFPLDLLLDLGDRRLLMAMQIQLPATPASGQGAAEITDP